MLAYYTDRSPFGKTLILIIMIIFGTWKIGIMLAYSACITIIISLAFVGRRPLFYRGDEEKNILTWYHRSLRWLPVV